MKEPRPDDERLSALLDGRLKGQQRDDVLAHLVAADEDYDVFTDAAAILREADEGTRLTPPPSLKRGRIWRTTTPRLAAFLVIVGLVAFGFWSVLGKSRPAGPLEVASALSAGGQGLPPGRLEDRGWGLVRGEDTEGEAAVLSARAGVLLADLAIAVQARDSATTYILATQLKDRFDARSSSPLEQLAARAGQPPTALDTILRQVVTRLEDRTQRDALRVGAWTETASIAAARGDAAFFRTETTRDMLNAVEELTRDDPEARAALATVRAATRGTPDWPALRTALDGLLRSITR